MAVIVVSETASLAACGLESVKLTHVETLAMVEPSIEVCQALTVSPRVVHTGHHLNVNVTSAVMLDLRNSDTKKGMACDQRGKESCGSSSVLLVVTDADLVSAAGCYAPVRLDTQR